MGQNKEGNRALLVRCTPDLKDRALQNKSNLKEKLNEDEKKYFVNRQLPEEYIERDREIRETVRKIKAKEQSLPVKEKSKIEVKGKKVIVDGQEVQKHLKALMPEDVLADQF